MISLSTPRFCSWNPGGLTVSPRNEKQKKRVLHLTRTLTSLALHTGALLLQETKALTDDYPLMKMVPLAAKLYSNPFLGSSIASAGTATYINRSLHKTHHHKNFFEEGQLLSLFLMECVPPNW